MSDKASPAGWVVQVTTPGVPSPTPSATGRLSSILGAPSFAYFNVAIADAVKAVEATTKHLDEAEPKDACVVRRISAAELAALRLGIGDIAPA
jgi:hypothetical protein